MSRKCLLFFLVALMGACAQVPKESVELSATVGRDLAVTHQAHRDLAKVLFQRMREDINRFIDDEYAPFQIRAAMARQSELANSDEASQRSKSLLLAIRHAFTDDAPAGLQESVLLGMEHFLAAIRNDVEGLRAELLQPLAQQEASVLGSIDRSYQQLHHANSIVTGHLSSVAKVHNTQAELLAAMGVERDLRSEIGDSLSKASREVSALVTKGERLDGRLADAERKAQQLREKLDELKQTLNQSKTGG